MRAIDLSTKDMSRFEIELIAAKLKKDGHRCIDRDWCKTTGETGCGVVDEMLMHLRNAWRAARPAHKVGFHFTAYDMNGRGVSDGYDMEMYGSADTLEGAREGAARMFARSRVVDRVAIRYTIQREAGQPWKIGAGIEGIDRDEATYGEAVHPDPAMRRVVGVQVNGKRVTY